MKGGRKRRDRDRKKEDNDEMVKNTPVWGKTLLELEQSTKLSLAHKDRPTIRMAPYGMPKTETLDILSISHNAVRKELKDMYTMYDAMANLGMKLLYTDVATSTLWFKDMFKFVVNNVLQWHWEVFLPWVTRRVNVNSAEREHLITLCRRRGSIELMANETAMLQESLFQELLLGKHGDRIRTKILDVFVAVNDLAMRLTQYMSFAEAVVNRVLSRAHFHKRDRSEIFRRLLFWIQDSGNVEMDVPMLLRWMSHEQTEEWLMGHGFQNWEHAISMDLYVKWTHETFYPLHYKTVEEMVGRAERQVAVRQSKKAHRFTLIDTT